VGVIGDRSEAGEASAQYFDSDVAWGGTMNDTRRILINAVMPCVLLMAMSSCAGGLKYPQGPMQCARPDEHKRVEKLVVGEFSPSPGGRHIAVATSRGLALYRASTLALEWFAPTWHGVDDIAWSPDEATIATSDASGCVFLWDAATGDNVQQLCAHSHDEVNVDWSARPDRLASGAGSHDSRYGEVLFWDTKSKKPIHVLRGVFSSQNDVEWSPEGSMLATWSIHDDEIALRDAETFETVRKLQMPENVMNVYWSPDGAMLAVPAPFYNDELIIWDTKKGDKVIVLPCDASFLGDEGVAWSSDSETIAAVTFIETRNDFEEDKTVMLWHVRTGEKLREVAGHAFCFSPDDGAVVVAVSDETLIVWDIRSGDRLRRLTGLPKRAESIAWSREGVVIVAGGGGWITAWNAETGERIRSIDGGEIEE
jgi:WD40 repeat protein